MLSSFLCVSAANTQEQMEKNYSQVLIDRIPLVFNKYSELTSLLPLLAYLLI